MKILITEEHPIVARAIRRQFEFYCCRVTVESDPRAAFELATTEDFDVIVCNWQMSKMPGSAFVRGVRDAAESDRRIVAVSASDSDESEAEARVAGAHEFFDKPVHREDVRRIIQSCRSTVGSTPQQGSATHPPQVVQLASCGLG